MPVVSVTIESANDTTVYITERQKFVVQIPGNPGLSAYGVAVKNGFVGTEQEWLDSLHGSDGGGSNIYTAGEDIGGQRLVMLLPDGKIYIYNRDEDFAGILLGLTNAAVIEGDTVTVIESGYIDSAGWGLDPGKIYFAGDNGLITTTAPSDNIAQRVGQAITTEKLNVHLSEPIILI